MAIYGNMVVPSKAAGGALPTDDSDRRVYVPGSEVSGRFSDQGGVLAGQAAQQAAVAAGKSMEGLGNLGKGIGALGSMGLAFYTRQRRIEHAEAMEAVANLQTEYLEKQREWSQIKGANALNMEELKSRWWDEAIPRLTQNLSDYGKRYFNLNADRVGAQADTYIQNHQEREIKGYEDQQFKIAMDAEGNQIAANISDPAAVNASLGRLRALWDRQCLRDGTPDDAREAGWRAMVGKAMGNAIGVRISMGDLDGANRLMMQYGASVSPEDQAKLRSSWAAGQMSELAGLAGAGKVDAIRQRLNANGAVTLQARLSQAAAMKVGEKYTWGNNDCSGHTCQVWQATLGDSPAKTAIFGRDGEHITAAEIMHRASDYTHRLYKGAEINPSSVKGGWLLASVAPSPNGRWNNIHHVVTTVQQPDGSIWVSEALGGPRKDGQVQLIPLERFLARYQGRVLYGADLSSLQPAQGQSQAGALPGGYKASAGAPYAGGKVHDISAPIVGQIVAEAQKQGVNPAQVLTICQIESSGNMKDKTGNYYGLFQLDQSDTQTFGKPGDDYRDQATNIRVGINQWKTCLERYKDPHIACVAYHCGIGYTDKWIREGADFNKLGPKTQRYWRRYDELMAETPSDFGGGASAGAPAQPQAQAPAVTMSKEARETYDAWRGMNLDRGQLIEMAQGMASSSDKAKSQRGKEILAALQSAPQTQAGAPSQAPVSAPAQGSMPQGAPAMGPGFQLTPAERQRAENEYVPQATANGIVDAAVAKGGSMAEIKSNAYTALESLPAGERDKYRPLVEKRLADIKDNKDAQDAVLYEQTIKLLAGMSPRDQETFIEQMSVSGKASPELIKKVQTWRSGVKAVEKESGEKWAYEMRGRMDDHYSRVATHSDALEREVKIKQFNGEITDETAQKLMEWSRTGGSRKNFTAKVLKELYNENNPNPKSQWNDPPEELIQYMFDRVRNGGDKPISVEELREMMHNAILNVRVEDPDGWISKEKDIPFYEVATSGAKTLGVGVPMAIVHRLKKEMADRALKDGRFKLNPDNPKDVQQYYAGVLGGKY